MMSLETLTVGDQITKLESEIALRTADIQNLTEAIEALQEGRSRPINPSADDAFGLLRELLGSAPQRLQERQIYEKKVQAARISLQLATEVCDQKRTELKVLRDEVRSQQQAEAFERLKLEAQKFNSLIDSAVETLDAMRLLASQSGGKKLEVVADLQELPYAAIYENRVKIRRRFDVRRA